MPNRIRQLREELHMTQVRLSIELEVSQETVSAYENQKHYPSFLQLSKMSALFHTSIDYIMGLSDVRNPTQDNPDTSLSRLIAQLSRLTSQQVELVSAYTQGLLDMARGSRLDGGGG